MGPHNPIYNWYRPITQVADPDSTELASDQTLNGLIDTYFAVFRAEKYGGAVVVCKCLNA